MALNVRDMGAVGDGTSSDHVAFLSAIEQIRSAGGGVLLVPEGVYRVGSLQLCSGLVLRLEAAARLLAIDEPDLFPVLATTANRPGVIRAMIWAEHASDITIEGPGTIDGGGDSPLSGKNAAEQSFRPALVFLRDCHRLRLIGSKLVNAQFWTLHMLRCQHVVIQNLLIRSHPNRINADGIDPDGCRNVRISGCDIWTGDDAIVLKSTEGDPCTDVRVDNCVLRSSCAAIKIGTESIGTISDISFHDCRVDPSEVALAVYMKDGGTYERITFSRITAAAHGAFPMIVDITPRNIDQLAGGRIRNITVEDVRIESLGRALFEGRSNTPLEAVRLRNLSWSLPHPAPAKPGGKPRGAARVEISPDEPDHTAGAGQFIFAHVVDLELTNLHLQGDQGLRSAYDMHHVRNLRIDGVPPPS